MADVAVANGRLIYPLPNGTSPQVENGMLFYWAVAAGFVAKSIIGQSDIYLADSITGQADILLTIYNWSSRCFA